MNNLEYIILRMQEHLNGVRNFEPQQEDINTLEKLNDNMRKEAVEEIQKQLDMYKVQYNWADELTATKSLIKKLKENDLEKIKIYEYILGVIK